MESINELREICQRTRDDKLFQSDWLDRNIIRRISIYPTKFFLKVGVSANTVTVIGFLTGLAAGALFTFPQAAYWLVAWTLLLLSEILDCCDGEVARYQGSATSVGEYNDLIASGYFFRPLLYACMSFGIYRALNNTIVLVFGFILVIGWMIYVLSPVLCQAILGRNGVLKEELERTKQVEFPQTLSWGIIPYCRMAFSHTWFFFALPIISLLDMFIASFSVGSLDFNIRFTYVALLTLAVVFGTLLRVYDINKHGIRPHK